jgi:hypothetical protein
MRVNTHRKNCPKSGCVTTYLLTFSDYYGMKKGKMKGFGLCDLVYFFLLRTTAATAMITMTNATVTAIKYQLTEAGVVAGDIVCEDETDRLDTDEAGKGDATDACEEATPKSVSALEP